MISRLPRAVRLAIAIAGVGLAAACQKVPLLAPSGSIITLTAANTALPLNGTTQLIAQVLEPSGTPPHAGTHIIFTTTLGSIEPAETETDINGRAVVLFRAGTTNGTATITASSGGVSASGNNAIKIAVGAAAVGRVTVDANPGTVPSSGGSSTITALVFDINGNPLGGVPVSFTTNAGIVAPSIVTADANGQAQTRLTTNKVAEVTATAGIPTSGGGTGTGGTGSTTTTQSAKVTVNVNSLATVTIGIPVPASPSAGQTVTLPLTYSGTGVSPISRVTVDWGDGIVLTYNGQPAAVSHNYGRSGSYLVVVTATDSFGDTSTSTAGLTVTPRPQPTVTIAGSPDNPKANDTVTFTIAATAPTGTGATITSVEVDFGDDKRVTLAGNATKVQHVYTAAGSYVVTATANDSNGGSGSGSTVIVVK